ncbi:AAA domain-containing protein [Nocardia jiangsuensis]|uniref:AAA domain-containing protein n=1 Tax=Nocardia jiangsuensis TaxID=1691563 RepID=A0ABV8E0Y8_9NOCA
MTGLAGGGATPADRGARLFQYLARVQDIGMTKISDVADLGTVLWLADLPVHPAVQYQRDAPGEPFLRVAKVRVEPVIELHDTRVLAWLAPGRIDDPDTEPELRLRRMGADGEELLSDHPDIRRAFDSWMTRWRPWAYKARRDQLAHRLYRELYDIYTRLSAASETTEAVLGLGCLSWKPPTGATVRRHVLTVPVKIDFDTDSGALAVAVESGGSGMSVELMDFLEHGHLGSATNLHQAEEFARSEAVDPFDEPAVGGLVRRVINCINYGADYLEQMTPAVPGREATGAYAPALILRSRGKRGLVRVLDSIARRIREQGAVPDGIRNLVDPDYVPRRDQPSDEGAIVRDGADSFLPMPLNDVQLRILDHVDSSAHTIVQGPPGTGKTHTAAALIAHLLAQGKRVLVTAHTDRALEEVRGKLPDAIKPLSVAVVGASRDSFADLEVAVERISEAAAEHDQAKSDRVIAGAQRRIGELRERRAGVMGRLRAAREAEVRTYDIAGYHGTLTALVSAHRADRERFGWIAELATPGITEAPPASAPEFLRWRELVLDESLRDPEVQAPTLVSNAELPPGAQVDQWFARRAEAEQRCRDYREVGQTEWVRRAQTLAPHTRAELQELVQGQDRAAAELTDQRETWIRDALLDLRGGRPAEWQTRAHRIGELLVPVEAAVGAVGISEITVHSNDLAPLVALAEAVLAHIERKGELKTQSDGSPKAGLTTAKVIKEAKPLFDNVRVDGRIPTTAEQLEKFRQYEHASRLLNQLDAAWQGVAQPPSGAPSWRLAWHRERLARLDGVLRFGTQLQGAGAKLRMYGLPEPDWADPGSVQRMVEAFHAVTALDELHAAQAPITDLLQRLVSLGNDPRATANLHELRAAVEHADGPGYHRALARLTELRRLRELRAQRQELEARITTVPALHAHIRATIQDSGWDTRLRELPAAWSWSAAGAWLDQLADEQVNDLLRELDAIEEQLRAEATVLAVTRAWTRAVGPGRLSNSSRADLRQYVQLVRKLGKGTGMYAGRRRAEIKQTLARCRSAVPVWIMPIYRVVEQLDIEQDMFDVVVVDEASQAGLESVFLQYLAPRIVVIGDDKQVSPSAVGVDQKELEKLAGQYLFDDKYRATWQEPKRSLFDEATMRFPARLTLREHRRCVPEIIGFSNKIAYEPYNVPLIPVRMFGADRLPPIRTVHVPDGANPGKNNVNIAEADRIVEQIERCAADPAYDGRTFGVISLLGTAQAKLIWDKLLARFQPEELIRRQLRCGDAADFQGAERDVVFLSMVKARGPEARLVAQSRDEAIQRYNVAVSRARDQLWLFHSVTLDDLRNPSDMRYRLLDYCLEAWQHDVEQAAGRTPPVPEDRVVAPFDSLFEQQVFNRIAEREYRVEAQYSTTGYDIDMVVTGSHARVAVQCDGDRWDGPEEFDNDLSSQRELQRCGWPFVRIRQSQFLRDPEAAMAPLWATFDEIGLLPVAAEAVDGGGTELSGADNAAADGIREVAPRAPVSSGLAPAPERAPQSDWAPPPRRPAPPLTPQSPLAPQPRTPVPPRSAAPEPPVRDYRAFTEPLAAPDAAAPSAVTKDLVRIIEVEGPVTGARLLAAYRRSTGGAASDATIEPLLTGAVEGGDLLADDPLGATGDPALRAYRTPEQPPTDLRTLGPRSVDQVPLRELAEAIAVASGEPGSAERREVMRRALRSIGQSEFTERAVAALALAWPLARVEVTTGS